MKFLVQEIDCALDDRDDYEIEKLFCLERMYINLANQISVAQSKFIFDIAEKYKTKSKVNWDLVIQHFEYNGSKEDATLKIKNHYYNKRSDPNRKKTRLMNSKMEKLGLRLN